MLCITLLNSKTLVVLVLILDDLKFKCHTYSQNNIVQFQGAGDWWHLIWLTLIAGATTETAHMKKEQTQKQHANKTEIYLRKFVCKRANKVLSKTPCFTKWKQSTANVVMKHSI